MSKYMETKGGSREESILGLWQEAAKKQTTETNKNDKSDDGEGLDAVQPKAVKKKFKDRKDKDIDNDGDTDSSDEFLHKKRKAISKAMAKETKKENFEVGTKERTDHTLCQQKTPLPILIQMRGWKYFNPHQHLPVALVAFSYLS